MSTIGMPMPGALRWRALHPLIEGDGTCSLIYDLERAAVLEVPEELQLHVATALETGDPDDTLLSWMVGEDLITMDGWQDWLPDGQGAAAALTPEPFLRGQGEAAHVRIGSLTGTSALELLDLGFRQAFGAPRVQVHLAWDGKLPGAGPVERIVIEAERIAADAGQEVSFDLAIDAAQVTPSSALFLAALPVHVRVRCGLFPGGQPGAEAQCAQRLLWMSNLADRVTLGFTLAGDARLKELWAWARRVGVRYLAAVRLPGEGSRDYEADLREIVEDIARDLEGRVVPVDFRPVSLIVRRLLRSEPLGLPQDQGPTDGAVPCLSCWARRLCRNSAALVPESEAELRTPESCAVWEAEAEASLRLYHRLSQADPLQVLRAFGETCGLPDELPASPLVESWGPKAPC